jgi:hypothetical protein
VGQLGELVAGQSTSRLQFGGTLYLTIFEYILLNFLLHCHALHCSLLAARCSLLAARCSLLAARYLYLLAARTGIWEVCWSVGLPGIAVAPANPFA